MFDPIKGPPNEFAGPSTGHSTENGDNWFTAIKKINAGFKSIVDRLENGVSDIVGKADRDARDRVGELENHVATLEERVTALEERFSPAKAMEPTGIIEADDLNKYVNEGDEIVPIVEDQPRPTRSEPAPAPKPMKSTGVARAAKVPANPEFGGGAK